MPREQYKRRPDLQIVGRTLIGRDAPRGQEMCDHYMGPPSFYCVQRLLDVLGNACVEVVLTRVALFSRQNSKTGIGYVLMELKRSHGNFRLGGRENVEWTSQIHEYCFLRCQLLPLIKRDTALQNSTPLPLPASPRCRRPASRWASLCAPVTVRSLLDALCVASFVCHEGSVSASHATMYY